MQCTWPVTCTCTTLVVLMTGKEGVRIPKNAIEFELTNAHVLYDTPFLRFGLLVCFLLSSRSFDFEFINACSSLLLFLCLSHTHTYRLNEANGNRNNANRLFNSQNNAAGGYCWGPAMSYYEGSQLTVEWTNQHGTPEHMDAHARVLLCRCVLSFVIFFAFRLARLRCVFHAFRVWVN